MKRPIVAWTTAVSLLFSVLLSVVSYAAALNALGISFEGLANGDDIVYGETTSITVTASNLSQVARVDLYANDKFLGSKTAAPFEFDIASLPIGLYDFNAIAVDAANVHSYATLSVSINKYVINQHASYDFEDAVAGARPVQDFLYEVPNKGGYSDALIVGDNPSKAYIVGLEEGATYINYDPPFIAIVDGAVSGVPIAMKGIMIFESKLYISSLQGTFAMGTRASTPIEGVQNFGINVSFSNGNITLNRGGGTAHVVQGGYNAGEWMTFKHIVYLNPVQSKYDFYLNDQLLAEGFNLSNNVRDLQSIRVQIHPSGTNAIFYALDDLKISKKDPYPHFESATFTIDGQDGSSDRYSVPVETNRIRLQFNSAPLASSVTQSRIKLMGPDGEIPLTSFAYNATEYAATIGFSQKLKSATQYKVALLPTLQLENSNPLDMQPEFVFTTAPTQFDSTGIFMIVNGVEQHHNTINANDKVAVKATVVNDTGTAQKATLILVVRSGGRLVDITSKSVDITGDSAELVTDELTLTGTSPGVEALLVQGWDTKLPFSDQHIEF